MIGLAFLHYEQKFIFYIGFLDGCFLNDCLLLTTDLNFSKDRYFLYEMDFNGLGLVLNGLL